MAILEADREGYLRSHRSLIQMIGRAARNEAGKVILYGDRVTDSMRLAVEETQRRRRVQETFNRERGIVPTTVRKEIKSLLPQELLEDQEERTPQRKGSVDRKELERMMWAAVERLDFEEAAALRDQITNVEGHHGVGEHSDTRRKAAQSKKRRRRPS